MATSNYDIYDPKYADRVLHNFADPNAKDEYDNTALMIAASDGNLRSVRIIAIEAGADVNAKNQFGLTALMKAAMNGHHEVAKMLLDAGADINAQDEDGMTALDWAYNHARSIYASKKKK